MAVRFVRAFSVFRTYGTKRQDMTNHKLLTLAVPAYNAATFLHHCLDTLVFAGDAVEVLVVNDGSKDDTLGVARAYQQKYPDIIVPVDQPNRNWGGVVNHALEIAQGDYFYIVDADDWLDAEKLAEVVARLAELRESQQQVDLFVVNYIYNRIDDGTRHTIQYRKLIPHDAVVTWDDLSKPKIDQYLMIHSMIYRTEVVRESGLKLPEGESYMDSLLMLKPLRHVRTLYYHDCDLYWYTIGREGQSVEPEVLKKHIDEQIHATHLAIDGFDYAGLQAISPRLASCSLRYLSAMMTVSSIHLFQINTPESIAANKQLWDYLRESDPMLYRRLHASFAGLVYRKTAFGRAVAKFGYNIGAKIFKYA